MVKELKEHEKYLRERNFTGFFCGSEVENIGMHILLEKYGFERLNTDKEFVWFKKEFKSCAVQ